MHHEDNMQQDGSPFMGWLGREAPGIAPRTAALSNNPKDAIGRAKTPMHLIPPTFLVEVANVMGFGAFTKGYGPYNWRDASVAATVYLSAAQRHLAAFLDGENLDPESGQPHTAHAAACMAILGDAFATGNVVDDRPKPGRAAAMMAGTPLGLPTVIEAMAKQATLSPMEQELFCTKVREQNGIPLPGTPQAKADREFLWYVATPYTACPDGLERGHTRAYLALRALLERGVRAFCPIAHTHAAGHPLSQDHEFWMAVDRPFMDRCDGLLVLRQPGWKESRGVTEEIQTFAKAGKPIHFSDDPNISAGAADWDEVVRVMRDAEQSPERYGWRAA